MDIHHISATEFDRVLDTARTLLGQCEMESNLWQANELVNKALKLRPNDSDAWILKCQVLSALDDDVAALAAIEMVVKRHIFSSEAHYWRAAVLADLGRHQEALKSIERAFRSVIDEDDWLLEDLYIEKAMILDHLGLVDKARQTYEAGLRICPESMALAKGLAPLQLAHNRSRFTILDGGRS